MYVKQFKLTRKSSDGPLDVICVVSLNALDMLPEEERRPGDEDDPGQGEDGEHAVPHGTLFLQEDPGQQRGEDWITVSKQPKMCSYLYPNLARPDRNVSAHLNMMTVASASGICCTA